MRETDLFPTLEPPADGLGRLRARLRSRQRRRWSVAAVAGIAALVALWGIMAEHPAVPGSSPTPAHSDALLKDVNHPALIVWGKNDAHAIAEVLPTGSPRVRIARGVVVAASVPAQ